MKILQVIHGYPMRYNAGSEVYTQGLAQALAERHEVHVFTRQENPFLPEYDVQNDIDQLEPGINLHVINMARARDGYRHQAVDDAFAEVLDNAKPDVMHVGHLNHLPTSLVFAARERGGVVSLSKQPVSARGMDFGRGPVRRGGGAGRPP